jgi:hypothetical protein
MTGPARPVTDRSPAETLRLAAGYIRKLAEAATPGPWQHMCMGSDGCLVLRASGTVRERGRGRVAKFWLKDWQAGHADAAYVAAMSPPVALAVADWLDCHAALIDAENFPYCDEAIHKYPLQVARAYLGETDD